MKKIIKNRRKKYEDKPWMNRFPEKSLQIDRLKQEEDLEESRDEDRRVSKEEVDDLSAAWVQLKPLMSTKSRLNTEFHESDHP